MKLSILDDQSRESGINTVNSVALVDFPMQVQNLNKSYNPFHHRMLCTRQINDPEIHLSMCLIHSHRAPFCLAFHCDLYPNSNNVHIC